MKPGKFTVDDKTVTLMRNCLLVAGHEMGEDGDHWPVINSTIHQIAKDWDDLKNHRAADAEMKKHVYAELAAMDRTLLTLPAEEQAANAAILAEIREIYDAYFTETDGRIMPIDIDEQPHHIRRAVEIVKTLEEEHVA